MKQRKQIDYETIIEKGITLIKEDSDALWECDDKEKVNIAFRVSGIVDFLHELIKATEVTKEDIEKIRNEQSIFNKVAVTKS